MQRNSFTSSESVDESDLYDVVIVGAGLGGLTVAFRLFQLNSSLKIKILEAKDRIGGRILTVDLPASHNSVDSWDMGGSWIGNQSLQPFINQLLSELNIDSYPQSFVGNKIVQTGKNYKTSSYDSSIPDIGIISLIDAAHVLTSVENIQKKFSSSTSLMDKNLLEYDSMTAETLFTKKTFTRCTMDCVRAGLRASFGSELNKLSSLYLFAFANSCGGFFNILESGEASARGYKIVGGASSILVRILEVVGNSVLEMETVVTSIQKNEDYSVIHTSKGYLFKAKHVVIAVPPHLILNIIFEPPLSPTKNEYFSSVSPGHLIKVILTYEDRFWRGEGFSGEVITNGGKSSIDGCSTGPLCIVFDATTENQSPALLGFIAGEQAWQYESKTKEERKEAVLNSLETYFSKKVRDFIVYCEKIWRHESFVGGCPVLTVPPGVGRHLNNSLRESENNLHFAGSEFGNTWIGFMEGAVESAERVALEIINQVSK